MDKYTDKSCPNPACSLFNQQNQGNIRHRSWTGKDKAIERLRCTCCKKEFSERRGTLLEYSHLKERTVELMLKCQRWGVCDEGIADISGVDLKTVVLRQNIAGERAIEHHHQKVRDVEDSAAQMDEAHSKLHGKGAYWFTPAITMSSLLILFIVFGKRNQSMANRLVREVIMRMKNIRLVLTDGWMPYAVALLKYMGERIQPKPTGKRGRPKLAFWQAPKDLLYAQVVKQRDKRGKLTKVVLRSVFGAVLDCVDAIIGSGIGNTIHTIHIERWFGSVRTAVACCRRKTRCGSKVPKRHEFKIWLFVDLYNWVLPHSSLSSKKESVTPAMAARLIDRPISYHDYIWMPIHASNSEKEKWNAQAQELDERANQKAKNFCFKQQYDVLKETS